MSLGSFQGTSGLIAGGGRQGENSAVPSVEQTGILGWGMCSQEPEEGVGKQGLCQFCGFRVHAERNSPRAQLSPTLLC